MIIDRERDSFLYSRPHSPLLQLRVHFLMGSLFSSLRRTVFAAGRDGGQLLACRLLPRLPGLDPAGRVDLRGHDGRRLSQRILDLGLGPDLWRGREGAQREELEGRFRSCAARARSAFRRRRRGDRARRRVAHWYEYRWIYLDEYSEFWSGFR